MQSYIALDEGLKAFILTLVNEEVVPADENVLAARLQVAGQRINPKELKTIMDFATGCGYVEKLGSQLAFTKLGRDKAHSYRRENGRMAASNPAEASDQAGCFVVPKGI